MPPAPLIHRRDFLKTSLLAALAPTLATRALGPAPGPGPIRRELFLPAPPNVSVEAASYYTQRSGTHLLSIHQYLSRSDTIDVAYFRYSADNGRTWTNQNEMRTLETRPGGKRRRTPRGCVLDPVTGRFLYFWLEATLPTDDPLEGMWQWSVFYSISEDGGYNWYLSEEAIQDGGEFSAMHPFPGIFIGHNMIMIGDAACNPIVLRDGTFLLPVITSLIGPDGKYFNPGGGYTYTRAGALRGRWAPDGRHLQWELSAPVETDPAVSTRGTDEPTLAELPDGHILMVIRGSNQGKPQLPGRRWVAYSSDQGRSWTRPKPWTYADGGDFHSPASSSQLITHSTGRIFWLGNICPGNPQGNNPRYPMIIGEVDRETGLLGRDSVRVVDDRGPHESPLLALASPCAREDRETGEIVVNMTRWAELSTDTVYNWTANAYLYRIPVL